MRRLLLALLLLAVAPATASAAPTLNGAFPVSETPARMTMGPDGNVWVILGGAKDVAKVAPDGTVTEYDMPDLTNLADIVAGPDGKLWATDGNGIGSWSPADPLGTDTAFAEAKFSGSQGLTVGPDGNLWIAKLAEIHRTSPTAPNPAAAETTFQLGTGTSSRGTAAGAGLIWVADFANKRILSVSLDGVTVTPYAVGGQNPQEVTGGPPNQVGYTSQNNEMGRIAPGGTAAGTDTGAVDPFGITFATDNAFWSANFANHTLGRLTPDGQYTTLQLPADSGPRHIVAGPGNTLWVALETSRKIARITGVEAAAPPPEPPVVSGLSLSATRFRIGSLLPRASARRAPTGTTIRFSLSEAARVRLSFTRLAKGRRVGRRCLAHTRARRKRRPCTRRIAVRRTLSFDMAAGARKVRFQGRLKRRSALRPGRYELAVRARDGNGLASKVVTRRFKLLAAKKRR